MKICIDVKMELEVTDEYVAKRGWTGLSQRDIASRASALFGIKDMLNHRIGVRANDEVIGFRVMDTH